MNSLGRFRLLKYFQVFCDGQTRLPGRRRSVVVRVLVPART